MRDHRDRLSFRPLLAASAARFGRLAAGGALLLLGAAAPAAAQQYISADHNVIVDYSALDRLGPPTATAPALGAGGSYSGGYMPAPSYGYQPSTAPSGTPESMLFVPKPFVPGPIAPMKHSTGGSQPKPAQAKPATSLASSTPTPPPAAAPAPQPLPPLVPSTATETPAAPEAPATETPAETSTAAATPDATMPAATPEPPVAPEPPAAPAETITPPSESDVSTNIAPPEATTTEEPPAEEPAAEEPAAEEPAPEASTDTAATEAAPAGTESTTEAPAATEPESAEAPAETAAEPPAEAEAPAESETASGSESETTSEEASEASTDENGESQTAALAPAPSGDSMQIVFAGESAELPPDILPKLDGLAEKLMQDENLRLQLMAYASGTEDTASKARRISLSRALAVRAYLIGKGIRSTRMDVRALGNKVEGEPADRVDIVTQTP